LKLEKKKKSKNKQTNKEKKKHFNWNIDLKDILNICELKDNLFF